MIRAMIFDLDGTLVRTEWLKGLSYARAIQMLSPLTITTDEVMDFYKGIVGLSREETSSRLVDHFGLGDAAQSRLVEMQAQYPWQVLARMRLQVYEEMLRDPGVLRSHQWPHTIDLLRSARRNNCRTALASMSRCEQVAYVLRTLELADQFDIILAREDVEHGKPDPEIYRLAARLLDVHPQECLVIEDSPVGVQAAVAAGMGCIAVATPLTQQGLRAQHTLAQRWVVYDAAQLSAIVEQRLRDPGSDV
jgi:HAD superfamily hydrolase (TIGR01509 family)